MRSGVTGSTLCVARFPQLTLAVGDDAQRSPLHDNHVRQCGPGKLDARARARGRSSSASPLQLRGIFLGAAAGTRVVAQARPHGKLKFVRAATTRSRRSGRFRLIVRPQIGEVVRLRSGSIHGPATARPRPATRAAATEGLRPSWSRCAPGAPYAGRFAVLQVQRHGRWVGVQRIELQRHSRARFTPDGAPRARPDRGRPTRRATWPATATRWGCRERRDLRRRRLALGDEPRARAAERAQHALDLRRDALLRRPAAAAPRERDRAARRATTASAASATSSRSRIAPSARPATRARAASTATSCARSRASSAAAATRTSRRSAGCARPTTAASAGARRRRGTSTGSTSCWRPSPRRRSSASSAIRARSWPRTRTGTAPPPARA